jgi:hypothetical protein
LSSNFAVQDHFRWWWVMPLRENTGTCLHSHLPAPTRKIQRFDQQE